MKVLLVSPLPPPEGGIASWTQKYLNYFQDKQSVHVEIVDTALIGKRGEKINARRDIFDEIQRTKKIIKDFKLKIKSACPQIIHYNTSCSRYGVLRDILCLSYACKKNIPVILQCHCNIEDQIKNNFSVKIFNKMAILAQKIIVLNSSSKNFLQQRFSIDSIIIPNFIEETCRTNIIAINETIKNILFVGHVQKSKGCMEIIETAKKYPDIQFYLVGPVAKEMTSVFIPGNVFLEGRKDFKDIELYLEHADLFLLPSYSEGFSVALLEAMSKGLPCIATDVGANKDMIEDKGGIIIPIKDTSAIVQALEKISQPTVRRAMSEWNIQKVKNEYLIDNVMQKILCLYEEIRK